MSTLTDSKPKRGRPAKSTASYEHVDNDVDFQEEYGITPDPSLVYQVVDYTPFVRNIAPARLQQVQKKGYKFIADHKAIEGFKLFAISKEKYDLLVKQGNDAHFDMLNASVQQAGAGIGASYSEVDSPEEAVTTEQLYSMPQANVGE